MNYHIIFYRILQYAIILIALTLRASGQYDEECKIFGERWDLPPLLIKAVLRTESGFCQFAWNDGKRHKRHTPLPPLHRGGICYGLMMVKGGEFEINENIDAGCSILRKCFDAYDNNLLNGLTAYNAGIAGARKYIKKKDYHYARKVLDWYWKYLWQDIIKNYELRIKNGKGIK